MISPSLFNNFLMYSVPKKHTAVIVVPILSPNKTGREPCNERRFTAYRPGRIAQLHLNFEA